MKSALFALVTLALLSAGCGRRAVDEAADTINVTVSITPQKYFVERVGGERVRVTVMVEPGASPATYEPKPEQLTALSRSMVYFSIGVPFEGAWLDKIASANEEMLIVDTAEGIERMPMTVHSHGGEEHQGGASNPDPHVWLSPALVRVQARTIYETLSALDPDHMAQYEANLEGFLADIDKLDAGIREMLAAVENRKFMVFHPSWGYFARDYGLEMVPVEIGGQEPSASELAALIGEAREEGIKVVFAQPEFSTRSAEIIADEIGGDVLLVSPLAEDWPGNLLRVAETFAEVLDR